VYKLKKIKISDVVKNSIADECEIRPGDYLLSINGQEVCDILDFRFLCADSFIEVEIEKQNGEIEIIEIEKDEDEDLGLVFENELIDGPKSCQNKCIFCFIDQLPKGMRKTLYFKDDDTRLSFFQGNYVTLTNMRDEDIEKIIRMRISPINISVHTTNHDLRVFMLKNKRAGKIYEYMKRFYENNITMNCQIVLCPSFNDGKELDRTIFDLAKLYPAVKSVSVVPIGLTKYREGLTQIEGYDEKSSKKVIAQVTKWQKRLKKDLGSNFVYLADEFYLNAKMPIPGASHYEGFPQIENGVGLMASFTEEIELAKKDLPKKIKDRNVSIITGVLAGDFIKKISSGLMEKYENLKIQVFPIRNDFFGEKITVAGLVTGSDIINQLKGKNLGDEAFIPASMLRYGDCVFLDDVTVSDLERELNVKITPVNVNGFEFISKILGII